MCGYNYYISDKMIPVLMIACGFFPLDCQLQLFYMSCFVLRLLIAHLVSSGYSRTLRVPLTRNL
jgi:hypothetical protein